MNGGPSQRARILRHVDAQFRDPREAFNRATHSDALREMQLTPAESLQAEDPPIGDPIGLIRSIGWPGILSAVAFAAIIWTGTIFFAVMCGGPQ